MGLLIFLISLPNVFGEPIDVSIGDEIIQFNVINKIGEEENTKDILETGFFLFVSLECDACIDAIKVFSRYFLANYDGAILIVGSPVKQEIISRSLDLDVYYFIDTGTLKNLGVRSLPIMLGYKEKKLQVAFSGPLNTEYALMILQKLKD